MMISFSLCMQCAIGTFAGSGASACNACSAGKYLTSASGGTEAAACTTVSVGRVWGNKPCCWLDQQLYLILIYEYLQCASGLYAISGATVCTACAFGKYLTNPAGGTEAASCTAVSAAMHCWSRFHCCELMSLDGDHRESTQKQCAIIDDSVTTNPSHKTANNNQEKNQFWDHLWWCTHAHARVIKLIEA